MDTNNKQEGENEKVPSGSLRNTFEFGRKSIGRLVLAPKERDDLAQGERRLVVRNPG
jgi:hypothetical protein